MTVYTQIVPPVATSYRSSLSLGNSLHIFLKLTSIHVVVSAIIVDLTSFVWAYHSEKAQTHDSTFLI